MKTSAIATNILMALALISFPMSASTLSVTGVDYSLGQVVDLSANGQSKVTFAGIIFAEYQNTPVATFCVDLYTAIGIETFGVIANPVDQVINGRRAAWLIQNFLPEIVNADQAAALQVAIWDVVHDSGNGLTNGSLRAGAAPEPVVLLAEQYIVASSGKEVTSGSVFTHVNGPLERQQLMTSANFTPAAFGVTVPEPATFLAMGAGLLILGAARRRRNVR
jgi:hypothetical protein